jgi:predicted DNA-binding antitoxin AbrB/MazE fold protein
MNKIHAVYKNGVFHPTGPVELPDHCEVEFEPRVIDGSQQQQAIDGVYAVLSQRYQSGESDVSARHDEHQ